VIPVAGGSDPACSGIRRSTLRAIGLAGLLFVLAAAAPAAADQDDPRLDDLFARLQATESPAEVERLTRRIWTLWRAHERAAVSQAMDQALAALAADRLARTEARLDRVVEMAPDYAEGWNQRATVRFLRGRFAESAADIRRVLELEPRHFGALEGLGLIYMEMGLPDAALSAFERALAVNPHLPGAHERSRMLRRERELGDS